MEARRQVGGRRGAEDVGAVPDRRDDGLVGRPELHAERRAQPPAEPARVRRPEAAPGRRRRRAAVQRVLVDDDRVRGRAPRRCSARPTGSRSARSPPPGGAPCSRAGPGSLGEPARRAATADGSSGGGPPPPGAGGPPPARRRSARRTDRCASGTASRTDRRRAGSPWRRPPGFFRRGNHGTSRSITRTASARPIGVVLVRRSSPRGSRWSGGKFT